MGCPRAGSCSCPLAARSLRWQTSLASRAMDAPHRPMLAFAAFTLLVSLRCPRCPAPVALLALHRSPLTEEEMAAGLQAVLQEVSPLAFTMLTCYVLTVCRPSLRFESSTRASHGLALTSTLSDDRFRQQGCPHAHGRTSLGSWLSLLFAFCFLLSAFCFLRFPICTFRFRFRFCFLFWLCHRTHRTQRTQRRSPSKSDTSAKPPPRCTNVSETGLTRYPLTLAPSLCPLSRHTLTPTSKKKSLVSSGSPLILPSNSHPVVVRFVCVCARRGPPRGLVRTDRCSTSWRACFP